MYTISVKLETCCWQLKKELLSWINARFMFKSPAETVNCKITNYNQFLSRMEQDKCERPFNGFWPWGISQLSVGEKWRNVVLKGVGREKWNEKKHVKLCCRESWEGFTSHDNNQLNDVEVRDGTELVSMWWIWDRTRIMILSLLLFVGFIICGHAQSLSLYLNFLMSTCKSNMKTWSVACISWA